MGGPCKNSSWINFCQLWLKCVVLDVSDTIVLCFILLLASLAPATINPTMVRQELQVTVATVTVVQPDRHHYSSSQLPRASERCCPLLLRGRLRTADAKRRKVLWVAFSSVFPAAAGEPAICIICGYTFFRCLLSGGWFCSLGKGKKQSEWKMQSEWKINNNNDNN